jgi:sialidase-1
MPRLKSLVRVSLLMASLFAALGARAALEQTVVFRAGADGYNTVRIPAILKAPNGDLLAFAEGRKKSPSDTGDIDLLLRRSQDGGKTWGAIQVLWDDEGNTCGNPCPVVDEKSGAIFLFSTHNLGLDREHAISEGTSREGRTVWVLASKDNGASWSNPVNITKTVKPAGWSWYATGPGIGIQLKHGPHAGRLVIPCDHDYRETPGGKLVRGSHAFFSDDHGATWQLGGTIRPDMNECQVAELFDGRGTLLMDMRSYRGLARRAQSRSSDGGVTWSPAVDVPALVEPICQASLLRWENAGGVTPGWLLFSNPADPKKRQTLTVRASDDHGATWSRSLVLHSGGAGYSCLIALSDSTAGCLYELGDQRPYEQIVFACFEAKDLAKP